MATTFRSQLAITILGVIVALPIAEVRAEDRSVTIIEGMPEPAPAPTIVPSEPAAPLQTNNAAGVHLDLVPGSDLSVGTNVVFRVVTQKPGYLILVDINADRTMTQIYPNVMSLTRIPSQKAVTNLIKPGTTVAIPDAKNPLAQFIFRTEPPLGHGIIVAILSGQPVQLIDLPELPTDLASSQAYVDALDQALRKLLVSDIGHPGKFDPGVWSLTAVEYNVK